MADYSTTHETLESVSAPWVLIAGGFHSRGGMDKANAALAEYLIERKTPVHLVAHQVDPNLLQHKHVTAHIVPRPLSLFFLGELYLERRGRAIARRLTACWPNTRVLVNGGNCTWPDINWVHAVHHAWPCVDQGAPTWFKIKNRSVKLWAKRRERRAVRAAHLVLANSERTRQHLIDYCGLDPICVRTVYLGNDADIGSATSVERKAARAWLGIPNERPVVIFVGALGHDHNKGFDILWSAWKILCERPEWDADLIVAGGGRGVARWQAEIRQSKLVDRVRFLGFTDRLPDLFAAADLLVSPVRYEAYGLSVQEAICGGVPAMVSARAGIAERYTPELAEMILPDSEDVAELVARLLRWRGKIDYWREQFSPLATTLRSHTWTDMAREIVSLVEGAHRSAVEPTRVVVRVPETA